MSNEKFTPEKLPQCISTVLAGLGSFGLGNVMAWSSQALPSLIQKNDLGPLTTGETSWIASLAVLGALISGPGAGWIINKIGRRLTMLGLAIPFLLGWFLMLFAQNVVMMYVGRFITGFAAGAYTIVITVYVSETIQDQLRGTLGSVRVLMLVSGMLFSYVIGAFASWFWLTAACALIPIIIFAGFVFMPESPRYLLLKEDTEKAGKSLMWLRGTKVLADVQDELSQIQQALKSGNEDRLEWKTILTPGVLKPTIICFLLPIFQQLGGINGVTFYTVEIFKSAENGLNPSISTIIFGIVQVAIVFLSLVVVDKVGRIFLLTSSFIVMCLSLSALGTYFYFKEQQGPVEHLAWLPLTSLVAYSVAFSIGAGPVPWLLMAELLPPHVKGHASGVITLFSWTLAFVATKTFQDIAILLGGSGSYWLYGAICAVGAVFTLLFVPETKGKSSEDIQNMFTIDGTRIGNGTEKA